MTKDNALIELVPSDLVEIDEELADGEYDDDGTGAHTTYMRPEDEGDTIYASSIARPLTFPDSTSTVRAEGGLVRRQKGHPADDYWYGGAE